MRWIRREEMHFLHIDNQLDFLVNLGTGVGIHLGDDSAGAERYLKDNKRPYRFDQLNTGFNYIVGVILLQKFTIIYMFGANAKNVWSSLGGIACNRRDPCYV